MWYAENRDGRIYLTADGKRPKFVHQPLRNEATKVIAEIGWLLCVQKAYEMGRRDAKADVRAVLEIGQ